MITELSDCHRSWIWSLALTIALGILAAISFSQIWPNTSSGWVIWLGLAAGGIGGLVHEFGQSKGKLLFFRREADGIYLGALAGMLMGMVAGVLAVQGLFSQQAPLNNQTPGAAIGAPTVGQQNPQTGQQNPQTPVPQRPLAVDAFYTAVLAGLALKGFAEAVGGQPVTTGSIGSGPLMTVGLPANPIPPTVH
jgi:hypothetical protein